MQHVVVLAGQACLWPRLPVTACADVWALCWVPPCRRGVSSGTGRKGGAARAAVPQQRWHLAGVQTDCCAVYKHNASLPAVHGRVHREKAHVHSVASNQMQMRMAPRMLWLATCSSHPPVSCLQVDMFTGESAVLVSLKELFETVLQGPQAGELLNMRKPASLQAAADRGSHVYTMRCISYISDAKQGARRRSLGLNTTRLSRHQHLPQASACTGCLVHRWVHLVRCAWILTGCRRCMQQLAPWTGVIYSPELLQLPPGSSAGRVPPGVFALVQFSRDSSSIVFLYHIGGCKAGGQAGAAGGASAGSRQTWTYLFTVAADGSNLWRVPVCPLHTLQLHTTARHNLTFIKHAPSSWEGLHCRVCCSKFPADCSAAVLAKSATG